MPAQPVVGSICLTLSVICCVTGEGGRPLNLLIISNLVSAIYCNVTECLSPIVVVISVTFCSSNRLRDDKSSPFGTIDVEPTLRSSSIDVLICCSKARTAVLSQ